MKKKQLEKLKKDPNLELHFQDKNKKDVDSLYCINLKVETKQKTTDKEKEIYGVEFKKGDTLSYPIDIATNDRKELIYIIKNSLEFFNHPCYSSYCCKDIFFNDFESARKYLELNIQHKTYDKNNSTWEYNEKKIRSKLKNFYMRIINRFLYKLTGQY